MKGGDAMWAGEASLIRWYFSWDIIRKKVKESSHTDIWEKSRSCQDWKVLLPCWRKRPEWLEQSEPGVRAAEHHREGDRTSGNEAWRGLTWSDSYCKRFPVNCKRLLEYSRSKIIMFCSRVVERRGERDSEYILEVKWVRFADGLHMMWGIKRNTGRIQGLRPEQLEFLQR